MLARVSAPYATVTSFPVAVHDAGVRGTAADGAVPVHLENKMSTNRTQTMSTAYLRWHAKAVSKTMVYHLSV
jgi:hypothetical protein